MLSSFTYCLLGNLVQNNAGCENDHISNAHFTTIFFFLKGVKDITLAVCTVVLG